MLIAEIERLVLRQFDVVDGDAVREGCHARRLYAFRPGLRDDAGGRKRDDHESCRNSSRPVRGVESLGRPALGRVQTRQKSRDLVVHSTGVRDDHDSRQELYLSRTTEGAGFLGLDRSNAVHKPFLGLAGRQKLCRACFARVQMPPRRRASSRRSHPDRARTSRVSAARAAGRLDVVSFSAFSGRIRRAAFLILSEATKLTGLLDSLK